jgi:uncharacterized BrkB/YihY/UPF0761 family membrane protein
MRIGESSPNPGLRCGHRQSSDIGENRAERDERTEGGQDTQMPEGERIEPTVSAEAEPTPAGPGGDAVRGVASVPDESASAGDSADEATGVRALVDRSRERIATEQARVSELIDKYHDRPLIDVGLRIYQRDREAAGAVVGSALAFRLFLFFVPLTLFVVGLLGFLARWIDPEDINETAGLSGAVAAQIHTAMSQPTTTRWVATLAGLLGTVWAGRSLSKVMVSASCLAWRLPVTTKASVRVIGSVVGLIVGIAMVAAVVNHISRDFGLGVASLSFLAIVAIYGAAWMAVSFVLPRATRDPGALLPGAVFLGVVLAAMQAIAQLYIPDKLGRASALYGALASTLVTLGWFFFLGRAIVFGTVLDAVIFERFGSISRVVFRLPIVRLIPPRSPWIRGFFDLPADGRDGDPAPKRQGAP